SKRASQTPDSTAVIDGERSLSYAELDIRAKQIASFLRNAGVNPEELVGLYFPRSWEAIIGILGILKSGGTYVPLDPAHPPERIKSILSDANISLVVTSSDFRAQFPSSDCRIVDICSSEIEAKEFGRSDEHAAISGAAYICYTSG